MTNAKDAYTKVFLRAANLETDQETLNKYNVVWWWNFRQKETGGLRLTEHALQFIEEHAKIKTYKVEFPKDFAITPQVLIWLDQFIDSPFFITKKYTFTLVLSFSLGVC